MIKTKIYDLWKRIKLYRYLIFLPILVFLTFALYGCKNANSGTAFELSKSVDPESFSYQGARVRPPYPKPSVVLTMSTGERFDFIERTNGFLTLLYFGYTNCPDICPLHMFEIDRVLTDLSAEASQRIQVIFITTDPERDTPERLTTWLRYFNNDFIGLTGSPEEIVKVLSLVGIAEPVKTDLGDDEYLMSHPSYIVAYTPDDLGHIVYPILLKESGGFDTEGLYGMLINDLERLALYGWEDNFK